MKTARRCPSGARSERRGDPAFWGGPGSWPEEVETTLRVVNPVPAMAPMIRGSTPQWEPTRLAPAVRHCRQPRRQDDHDGDHAGGQLDPHLASQECRHRAQPGGTVPGNLAPPCRTNHNAKDPRPVDLPQTTPTPPPDGDAIRTGRGAGEDLRGARVRHRGAAGDADGEGPAGRRARRPPPRGRGRRATRAQRHRGHVTAGARRRKTRGPPARTPHPAGPRSAPGPRPAGSPGRRRRHCTGRG